MLHFEVGLGFLVVAALQILPEWAFAVAGVLILLHYSEAFCCSPTSKYLSNVMDENEFTEYIHCLQGADPNINFTIQNYHYETRTRVVAESARAHSLKLVGKKKNI